MTEVVADAGRAHWEQIYSAKGESDLSWHQDEPTLSLALIRAYSPTPSTRVIDVGGGSSTLVDRLLAAGYPEPAVLDLSENAIRRAQLRLGEQSSRVRWLVGDITRISDLGTYDLWHDRAVFHFLTDAEDRARYKALAEATLPTGGHLVIATFGLDGPERCSGLEVCRYDAQSLAREFTPRFRLVRSEHETHLTPWGAPQSFVYCVLRKQ